MVTRRKVLQGAVAVAASSTFSASAQLAAEPGWFDKPMRWAQLNSTEDDAAEMDIPFWMDYFSASTPTRSASPPAAWWRFTRRRSKYHRPSRWLDSRPDYFRQVVEGCRKLGMSVVARTDPHATYEDVYRDHPDWIAVDAGGRKRRHWEMPEMWVTCALGPYNFEFMTEVTKEIVATFPEVGGIFSNRWEGSGMCYCEHCVRNFRDYCGMEPSPHRQSTRSGAAKLHCLARGAPVRALAVVGWRDPQNQSRSPLHRELRRRQRRARHARRRRTRAHAVRRSPGPQRRDGSVGQRQEWQGVPLDARPQTHRRHLSYGRGDAAALARFRPERQRDAHLGARRRCQRPAALVQQSRRERA